MITKDNIYKSRIIPYRMANKLFGIRLSDDLLRDAEGISKKEGFSSVQEFVRQAVRESLKKYKLQQQLIALDKLAGSQPHAKKASKKALERHIRELYS
jgi:metal-responsive CopG/Arc/MetJ family transcriptional regulator